MQIPNKAPQIETPQEEGINVRHYWHIILERRWLVITSFITIFILSLIYLYRAPRVYQAKAVLQINRENDNILNIKDAFSFDTREQDYLQTQYKVLQSRTLFESVIKSLKLDTEDARYNKSAEPLKALSSDITVSPVRLSRLVEIKGEHTNATQAATIVNELVNTFVANNLDRKKVEVNRSLEQLKASLQVQKEAVVKADTALNDFKLGITNISVDANENIIFQALRQAQEQLALAQSKASNAIKLSEEVKQLLSTTNKPVDIPQVISDKQIMELKVELAKEEAALEGLLQRYKDKWPDVKAKRKQIESIKQAIANEASQIINAIYIEAKIAKATLESQQALVDDWMKKQLNLGEHRTKYDQLLREAEQQRSLYMTVLKAVKDQEVMIDQKMNNMYVVDSAKPPLKAIKPRIALTLLFGFFGGLVMSCGLAFFVNYLDDSIKSQDDVEIYLKMPFLGYVPNIKSNSVIERDLQSHLHPQSSAAEGFRTIRAAVSLMPNSEKYRLLVVTSTIPSEGKSLLASNLAIVTAQTGLKTLLVDADLRRPSVHKAFQLHSPIGLSAYLSENVNSMEEITHSSEVPNLDVICAGAIPNNPSELSGSKRMRQFILEASKRYDRVFLDCPPVSAVSDPLVVASMADGVIFLTKFNKIRREHARKSLQRLQDSGIRVLGVVLNDIDFEGRDSYYYSYYYYQNRYYSSHYRSSSKRQKSSAEPESADKA